MSSHEESRPSLIVKLRLRRNSVSPGSSLNAETSTSTPREHRSESRTIPNQAGHVLRQHQPPFLQPTWRLPSDNQDPTQSSRQTAETTNLHNPSRTSHIVEPSTSHVSPFPDYTDPLETGNHRETREDEVLRHRPTAIDEIQEIEPAPSSLVDSAGTGRTSHMSKILRTIKEKKQIHRDARLVELYGCSSKERNQTFIQKRAVSDSPPVGTPGEHRKRRWVNRPNGTERRFKTVSMRRSAISAVRSISKGFRSVKIGFLMKITSSKQEHASGNSSSTPPIPGPVVPHERPTKDTLQSRTERSLKNTLKGKFRRQKRSVPPTIITTPLSAFEMRPIPDSPLAEYSTPSSVPNNDVYHTRDESDSIDGSYDIHPAFRSPIPPPPPLGGRLFPDPFSSFNGMRIRRSSSFHEEFDLPSAVFPSDPREPLIPLMQAASIASVTETPEDLSRSVNGTPMAPIPQVQTFHQPTRLSRIQEGRVEDMAEVYEDAVFEQPVLEEEVPEEQSSEGNVEYEGSSDGLLEDQQTPALTHGSSWSSSVYSWREGTTQGDHSDESGIITRLCLVKLVRERGSEETTTTSKSSAKSRFCTCYTELIHNLPSQIRDVLSRPDPSRWYGVEKYAYHYPVPTQPTTIDLAASAASCELCALVVRGFGSGTLVNPDPASKDVFETLNNWVAVCVRDHEECESAGDGLIPTRMIDRPPHGYITTKGNLTRQKMGMDISAMPQTFQDATRGLGLRYLWIDSLCIIQDDSMDWQLESVQMASIYRNAFLVISASNSSADTKGFLRQRDTGTIIFEADDGEKFGLDLLPPRRERPRQKVRYNPISGEPVKRRAWILQEQLLSRRTIIYSKRQIFWECLEFLKSEGSAEAISFLPLKLESITKTAGIDASLFSSFYFREADCLNYHGWYETASPGDLLSRQIIYRAPSWSWVSVHGNVIFPVYDFHDRKGSSDVEKYENVQLAHLERTVKRLTPSLPWGSDISDKIFGITIPYRGRKKRIFLEGGFDIDDEEYEDS
ncbi:hypothetical protein M501DRAFT_985852 [Patellaria atrata CBS 101060]|uniref:Heterokaryon incompatibility domain-containing protein n=1 Tax=Patellaria atrata CBS 101060 TaxID=1346257 RepID=A0A9P4SK28_9PEZI|nr:hypothetical protein M501DRAFT_985852 [Patellaria atrata CBS 101060]